MTFSNLLSQLTATHYYIIGGVAAVIAVAVLIAIIFGVRKKRSKPVNDDPVKDSRVTEEIDGEIEKPVAKQEPVAEPKTVEPEREERNAREEIISPEPEDDDDVGEEAEEHEEVRTVRHIAESGKVRYIIIKYKKSFTAKLIQSADITKQYYSELKNELLSFKGIKNRISWKHETFNVGRRKVAKLSVRGKSLYLYLALDPKQYEGGKYIVEDKSEVASLEGTPLLYKIKNDRRLKYAKELIAEAADGAVKLAGYEALDWAKDYPYDDTDSLVERGLIKVLTDEDAQSGDMFKPRDVVLAAEVNELLRDEVAVTMIRDSEEISDRRKIGIVNIDMLSRYFEDGETVTLEEIKNRVPKTEKNLTGIKVLARGALDKKLTVIADNFSIEAAKMILLTGGTAVRKKSR